MRTRTLTLLLALAGCGGAPVEMPALPAPAPSLARVDVPGLKTDWTPEAITAACAEAETEADARLARLAGPQAGPRTFETSFGALEEIRTAYVERVNRLHFMRAVHLQAPVREAAAACEERSGKYLVALRARVDLYEAMKQFLAVPGAADALDAESKRLVELTMRDFQRDGLALPEAERKALVELRQRLTELETRFHRNLGEDATKVLAAPDELEGLPADFVARHEKSADGKVVLTVKYPDYYPVMENAKSEALRRRMLNAFDNRAWQANLPLLNEAVALRAKAAKMLGFSTHSDFVAQPNMAKDAKTIATFLTRMQAGLKPARDAYTAKMTELKRAETKDPNAVVNAWDWRYYMNQIRKRDFAIDDEVVRSYLPVPKVMDGLFAVYARMFGLKFVEVPGAPVWADGVKLYEVRDAADNGLTACFYVDMFPREGKYGHAAEFNMNPGHAVPGGYSIPLSVLVVNFEPPAAGKVAHLSIDEVETLFHEFGHVMHESLTTARYASLAGTSTARDFVEAPSQMLENWVYQPEVLALLSEDPANPGQPMPKALMESIARARNFDAGVAYTRQVYFGLFDQAIHTRESVADANAVARQLYAEVVGFPEDADTHFAATFGHVMGGYDGGYYGYLWSLVFSSDMFTRFKREGIFNGETGKAYRDLVLARGRVKDADALLRDFLGREPNETAFLEQLGIQGGASAQR